MEYQKDSQDLKKVSAGQRLGRPYGMGSTSKANTISIEAGILKGMEMAS